MKLIFLYGPTAVGKTQLSLQLSEALGFAPLINADSLQVYKGFDIGSAKVSKQVQEKYPHSLLDILNYPEVYTMGNFYKDFRKTLEKISHPVAIVVGGSAFYLRALQTGLLDVGAVDEKWSEFYKDKLEKQGVDSLYEELQELCPDISDKISAKDQYRIFRALTLFRSTGQSLLDLSEEHELKPLEQKVLKVGLCIDRDELRQRVTQRVDQMFEAGLITEVEGLLKDRQESWKPLESIGYKEVVSLLKKEITLDQAKAATIDRTMSLAKRQMTWFRKENDLFWFHHSKLGEAAKFAKQCIEGF